MRYRISYNTLRAFLLYLPVMAALALEKLASGACAGPQQALVQARSATRCTVGRQFARVQRRRRRTR